MSTFTIHSSATAPQAKPLLDAAQKAYGLVPNLLGVMAEAPALLEGYMALMGIFDKTSLSATERQIIFMVNNRLNGCGYCMAAHTTVMQKQKLPEDVIQSLRDGTSIADPKLEALRVFAVKVNESRGWPEARDIEALLAAGYSRQTVLEVILGTGIKVLSNYTNHVAATPVDTAFQPNAWQGTSQPLAEKAA